MDRPIQAAPVSATSTLPSGQPASNAGVPTFLLIIAAVLLPIAVTYGMATDSEVRVVAVIIALLVGFLVVAQPMWGLVAFTALLFTRPEDSFPALAGMRMTLGVSVLALLGLLTRMALNREPMVRTPFMGTVALMAFWAVLSTFNQSNTVEALQDVGKLAIMAFLVLNLSRDKKQFWILAWAVVACSVYLAVNSQYMFFSGQKLEYQGMERALGTGIFGDPNDLAASLVFGLGLALMLMVRQTKLWLRIVLGLLCAELSWAIFMTNSRGGMLAFLAVVGCFFIMSLKQKTVAIVLAALAVQLFLLVGPSRMTTFDKTEESANSRFWFWSTGIDLLKDNPITGVGMGRFAEYNGGMVAHNTYVQCFGEIGFPGYCFFIGSIYYCFRRRLVEEGDESPDPDYKVVLGCRLALIGFLVGCFFITRTFTPNMFLFLALPVAAERVFLPPPKPKPDKEKKGFPDWARITAIAFASVMFIKIFAEANR